MNNKYCKTLFCLVAIIFAKNIHAQKYHKKYTENFNVNKDVEIQINASNTEIVVSNWNKNEVQVEATIEIEGISKEEAERYIKNWKFEALGNKNNIKISAHTTKRYAPNTNFDATDKIYYRYSFPESVDMDSIFVEKITMPKMDFNFNFGEDLSFSEAFSFDNLVGKNGNYSFQFKDGETDIKINSKEDWEKFKKSKEYQKWKENLAKNREEVKRKLEVSREKIRKQLEETKQQFEKIDREKIERELEKSKEAITKWRYQISNDEDVIVIDGKKVKITKKIEIKVPNGATFDLNTRHCKIKLPNTVASGNIKYGSFNANNLINSKLAINYSPITINDLNACKLFINNVTDAKIASVTNSNLNTNSSKIAIQNIYQNVEVISKFGEIEIRKIHPNFKNFILNLNAATAILNNIDLNNKLLLEINYLDNYKNNSPVKWNVSNQKSKEIKGNFNIKSKDNSFLINGKYSQIIINQ